MKKILFLIALVGFFVNAQGQELKSTDVPAVITDSFNDAYPAMQDVKWNRDGNNYSARYEENKLGRTVLYNSSGKRVSFDEQVDVTSVPYAVNTYYQKNYQGKKMDSAWKVTNADGTVTYKTNMEGKDLFFDPKGNYLKSVDNNK